MTGQLSFLFDQSKGYICVSGSGLWTIEQARAHFAKLYDAIAGLRARRQPVLVLVDLREASVQSASVADIVSQGTSRIYSDSDFVALVASTTLLSMQMRRAALVSNMSIFTDIEAAYVWLRSCRDKVHI